MDCSDPSPAAPYEKELYVVKRKVMKTRNRPRNTPDLGVKVRSMTLIHTSNKRILSFDHPHKFNDRGLKMPGKRMGSKEMQHTGATTAHSLLRYSRINATGK